jgi:hypothetical protein
MKWWDTEIVGKRLLGCQIENSELLTHNPELWF